MGCDIHIYTEVLKTINGEPKWCNSDHWLVDPYTNLKTEVAEIYEGRSYRLFALLADIRNGGDIEPLDYPRGMPLDISPQVKEEYDIWDSAGHSHSWFTLKELKLAKYALLDEIIDNLETRKRELFWCYKETEYDEKIRIVFWFDN